MKAKVAVVRCRNYIAADVEKAVGEAVSLIGGLSDIIKSSDTVLLKPNLLAASPPETGINTHPEVVRAVIGLVKPLAKRIIIGDSPGGFNREDKDEVYRVSGIEKVAKEEGVEVVRFSTARRIDNFPFAAAALDADAIISIPKFKTHTLTIITCAIKNLFGLIVGHAKPMCHKLHPAPEQLSECLVDVFERVKPVLTIVDGIVGMEGDGPARGGSLRKLGLVLAGRDAVAIDAVAAGIMNYEPLKVWTTKIAAQRGVGEGNLANIEVLGERFEELILRDFKLPKTAAYTKLPAVVLSLFKDLIKFYPVIDSKRCVRCKICAKSCPADAIKIEESQSIKIDYKNCLRCFCCQEMCPEAAVEIKRSWLAKVMGL